MIKNVQIEISNWLNSERNYADGVYLYDKYGKNPQLKRLFPDRETRYADKLAYELAKLIGYRCGDNIERINSVCPEFSEEEKQSDGSHEVMEGKKDQIDSDAYLLEDSVGKAAEFAEKSEEHANRAEEEADRAEEFAEKLETAAETIGAIAKGGSVENPAYPPVINRLIAESARLYNERALLKKQQNAIPDENTHENISARKTVIDQIEAISVRLDVLYMAKSAFLEKGTLPEENELFNSTKGIVINGEADSAKLMQQRNNLRSQITRAKNMLEFQNQKRSDKPNPMPPCPKRKELEQRIREKEKLLSEVEEKLASDVD